MRIACSFLIYLSVFGATLFAQEPTPTPASAAVIPATPAASPSIPEPVLLPEPTPAVAPPVAEKPAVEKPAVEKPAVEKPAVEKPAGEKPAAMPVSSEARDEAFKEVGETPPSAANPPPAAQGAPPVGGEDVIPLPDGTAIPVDDNQMPSQPSTADDEQLVLPGEIPAPDALAIPVGPNQTGPSARDLQAAYVKARTEVDKDPKVRSLKDQADAAKTDEAKRQALRAYYRLLFQKIRKLDPSLTKKSDIKEAAYLRRLEQNRIEPSIPLTPPPKPEPLP